MSHARAGLWLVCVAALCVGCASRVALRAGEGRGFENPDASWRIVVDPELRRLDVRACFSRSPGTLVPGTRRAGKWLLQPRAVAAAGELAPRGPLAVDSRSGGFEVPGGAAARCVDYSVNLARLVAEDARRHETYASARCVVLNPDLFLWRPRRVAADFRGAVHFVLPEGFDASTAWPRGPSGALDLDASALEGTGRVVLGRFSRLRADVGTASLDVAVVDGPRAATDAGIRHWLSESARANALVYGQPPTPSAQVIVIPVEGDRARPVVFGMALRGGGPALVLLLDKAARDLQLPGEWIAIHELFHLGMPAIRRADAWLSEGVTMYYSEILRARAGFATPDEAWQRVHDGFGRGRRESTGRTLADESAAMRETASYMRVYWGGAAIALAWDVAIREASAGEKSLDDALRHLHDCCREPARFWSAAEVIATLDRWWGSPLFSGIAEPALASAAFPDLSGLYSRLGLLADGTDLRLLESSASALRDAITAKEPAR
ncbi:MAG: hypothetical protein R3F39_13845 [Myxococcota bacterium]